MGDLSVVIATYNRAGPLKRCLDALAHQTPLPDDVEVVVVIDGSTDGTQDMLAAYAAPFRLRVLRQENAGHASAVNRGVATATGRFCLLLDDDVRASPRLVAEHVRAQRGRDGVLAIGYLELATPLQTDWFVPHVAASWARHYARLGSIGASPTFADCYTGNLSFPRSAFLAVNGFATDLARGDDVELAFRLVSYGLSPVYLPEADAIHDERKAFRQLIRDQERAGAAAYEIYRRHPSALVTLGLGSFDDASLGAQLLRRALLTLRVPSTLLGFGGAVLDRLGRSGLWARFVRRYAFWRGVRRAVPDRDTWRRLTAGVPILMYHALTTPGEAASRYVISARRFAWQMRWLRLLRRRVVGLDEYLRCRREHRLPPARTVVITLDDGYVDNGEVAGPLLDRFGFPATIFLVTDYVGTANRWDARSILSGRPLLGWDAVGALERTGLRFAAHSRRHPFLTTVERPTAEEEIRGSKAAVEAHVAEPVPAFAYPHGDYDEEIRKLVERAGFWGALTTRTGLNRPATAPFALRRVEIKGEAGMLEFLLAIWVGDSRPLLRRRIR